MTHTEWQERYDELQKRVTRFSVVEQELINTRDRLDREVERFGRIHAFNTRAIQAHSPGAFATIVAEAIVDVFELGFGGLWVLEPPGKGVPRLAGLAGIELTAEATAALGTWLGRTLDRPGRPRPLLLGPAETAEIGEVLPARQLVVASCRDAARQTTGYLLGGITGVAAEFHDAIKGEHLGALEVFAQQVAALLENRRGQAIIEEQIHRIELSEERLALALEGSSAGLWDWQVRTGEVYFSATWLGMIGYQPGELPASLESWRSRVHPDDLPAVEAALTGHLEGRAPSFEHVFRLRHRDGRYLWMQSRGRALRDAEGRAYRMVGTHIDVSAQKELEGRLREAEEAQRLAREQAESASRAKSVFLANMSHELRTPLNGVLGAVELLRTSTLSPAHQELVEAADQSARALLGIIGDILDLSKIEAGKCSLEITGFAPSEVVRDAVAAFDLRTAAKGLTLRLDLAPDLPSRALGDPTRLTQVLNNLLGNALKFTHTGGVSVEVCSRPTAEGGPGAEFSVRDTGIGMAPEVVDRLFSPFMQADSSTTRRFGGTGLGLAISRRLVELMGGRIGVQTSPGQGSDFRFWIPLPPEPPARTRPRPEVKPARVADLKLQGRALVVEDTPLSRRLAVLMATASGLEVDTAADGREAVERVQQAAYDVVFMDCNMPELDGYGAAQAIRELEAARGVERGQGLWIIALTANALSGERERCLAAGMDDYLAKPLTTAQFAAALARSPVAAVSDRRLTAPAG